jgi:glucosamine--fructose-6-phosphate aminotransferase (isomerizing)
MLRDILDQPKSLEDVLAYHLGAGRPALEQAAAFIRDASRIVITGMGASLYSAMALSHHLVAHGLPAVTIEAGELLHFAGEAARGAVVLLVSRSGETVEAVKLLPLLQERNARIVGITNEPDTTLAREAHLTLTVGSGRDEAVAIQTYTGTTMLMLLLAAAVAGQDRSREAAMAIHNVAGSIEAHNRPERWNTLLGGAHTVYILGRGQSLGSAFEGGLLFNESAKLPSVAMASSNFRHGHIEVVDDAFRAFLFASEPAAHDLDDALASNLLRMGGRIYAILEGGHFSPVSEFVPLQLAAYYAAEIRGFEPGKFRHVSVVTASETDLSG